METAIAKQLIDKIYEKRKAAALDLEKQIRECHTSGDDRRIQQIIDQLVDMFSNAVNPLHVRNGGLIGLAGTAIALGVDVAPYMDKFIHPLLDCFVDQENRIRYFSAECLYNICKVSKGEVLVYFNEIFDALSKLAADSELSVKNGAELLDRLLKDIVAETASVYVPQYPETEKARDQVRGVLVPRPDAASPILAFSLAHFIPLLHERISVVSPFTRSYLVSWITVLDSVPELELITYLPEFLDGLLKYLSDPSEDVRVATKTLLAEFLREIRDVSTVQSRLAAERAARAPREPADAYGHDEYDDDRASDMEFRETGTWIPGQGVRIDYAAIVEILILQLDGDHDEIQQSTALRWLAEFLTFASDVMLPFTPRLIPAVLPNLAHHVDMIQGPALRTNKLLMDVIQDLPPPQPPQKTLSVAKAGSASGPSPTPSGGPPTKRDSTSPRDTRDASSPETVPETPLSSGVTRSKGSGVDITIKSAPAQAVQSPTTESRAPSPALTTMTGPVAEDEPFDYQATVTELTVQFLSEYEETRVSALKWLIMLHQKAPRKILAMDDGTFPALLKTLSDNSEEVIKHDLQLLAQISSSSEEGYFRYFMEKLLELFSTDRRLLETRGSLIIRQLCLNLNHERIYRMFAEILEQEDDLEFASVIVQKLNIILITSPELAEFRKRLKTSETRADGAALFTTLYRSWCHNAVAVFSLCLLAQAYEHASSLLYIFAELEITVPMLVQIDKLVQLIESPVFTYLRLQLLEPDRHPHLFKCLYGLLMLLPQSSAFVALRNRLNAVNSGGFMHIAPRTPATTPRAKMAGVIPWTELVQHFRAVQSKHEKARRQAMGGSTADLGVFDEVSEVGSEDRAVKRPNNKRRVTGDTNTVAANTASTGTFPGSPLTRLTGGFASSPLNPSSTAGAVPSRARGGSGSSGIVPAVKPYKPSLTATRNVPKNG